MKKLIPIFLLFTLLPACTYNPLPSGGKNANTRVVTTEARPAAGFLGVKVANNIALELTVGADFGVSVEGDENLLKMLTTEVQEGHLIIALGEKFPRGTRVPVKVSMPELKELEVSGGSTAVVTGASGEKVRLQANGATNIKISGDVKELDAHAYGASIIDAEALKAGTATVEALGSSRVAVSPSTLLKARTLGIANVTYTGDPKVEKSSSNSSSVKKKE
jgi:hypothetical protein